VRVPPELNTYMNSKSFMGAKAPLLNWMFERQAPTRGDGARGGVQPIARRSANPAIGHFDMQSLSGDGRL
jgi:hypothetical protein